MGDSLSKAISHAYLYVEIVEVVRSAAGQRHMWAWLTKQPRRMAEFSAYVGPRMWPANLAVGTSITEPRYVDRIEDLLAVGDATTTRFLSVEPQHQKIDLVRKLDGIAWIIQGGESGPAKQGKLSLDQYNQRKARPFDIAWARDMRDTCSGARVKYFLKQLGSAPAEDAKLLNLMDGHGGDWDEWPKDLRVREMPAPSLASPPRRPQRMA
jgi:protein gp37